MKLADGTIGRKNMIVTVIKDSVIAGHKRGTIGRIVSESAASSNPRIASGHNNFTLYTEADIVRRATPNEKKLFKSKIYRNENLDYFGNDTTPSSKLRKRNITK